MKALLWCATLILTIGCCHPLKGVAILTEPEVRSMESAEEAWWRHRNYLAEVVNGGVPIAYQFDRAIEFFTRLTGIPSGLSAQYFGYVLDEDLLKAALEKWDDWYRSHAGEIRWDADKEGYTTVGS